MKIVHLVLSNVYAGIEQHVNELTLNLEQESDVNVSIVCNKEIASKFETSNIIVINNFSRRSPLGLIKLLIKLYKIKPDIIHTHGSKTTSIINNNRWSIYRFFCYLAHRNQSCSFLVN